MEVKMASHLILANAALLFLTVGGNFVLIPLHASLICTAFLVVYIGCHRSLSGAQENGLKKEMETMERHHAYQFPIMAGCTLTGLFMLFRFIDKDMVNLLITAYVGVLSVAVCSNEVYPIVRIFFPSNEACLELSVRLPSFQLPSALSALYEKIPSIQLPSFLSDLFSTPETTKPAEEKQSETESEGNKALSADDGAEKSNAWQTGIANGKAFATLAPAACISLVAGIAVTFWYIKTRHWVANNLIGIAMSLQSMESLSLGTYKTGVILLVLLFFYDIFFVFGTDVMVTVAKSVDAPIKLLFIKAFAQADADAQFSMLGLGDIVLPGVFVALLLRFDAARAKLELGTVDHSSADFPKPVFNITVLFYALGLWATVLVMHVFKHPQPALLYLVPACLMASVLAGLVHGCFKELYNFDETPKKPEEQGAVEDKKEN